MTRVKRWWDDLEYAFERAWRVQRPWEQEGPLRWVRPLGSAWELHGSTLPAPDGEPTEPTEPSHRQG